MIELIVTIAILGLIVWAITTLIPMPENFKKAIYIIALVCLLIFVLRAFGIVGPVVHDISVPQLR